MATRPTASRATMPLRPRDLLRGRGRSRDRSRDRVGLGIGLRGRGRGRSTGLGIGVLWGRRGGPENKAGDVA